MDRAAVICREGNGPVLIERAPIATTATPCPTPATSTGPREEEAAWRAVDPIERLKVQLLSGGTADEAAIAAIETGGSRAQRSSRDPRVEGNRSGPADLLKYLYTTPRPTWCQTQRVPS